VEPFFTKNFNSAQIQYLAAPLNPLDGTLMRRGTPVRNHCSTGFPRYSHVVTLSK
jgi:hypothetical protein